MVRLDDECPSYYALLTGYVFPMLDRILVRILVMNALTTGYWYVWQWNALL